MDWTSLIAELTQLGYTQPEIAKQCGCGQATISDLASGKTKEPRHSLGEDLRRLLEKARDDKTGA
jgi:transcriptional regulator with XRE-family HTH domain